MTALTTTTRVFINGNSQAVRIPLEFRLDTSRVEITRTETGDLVIHPLPSDRGEALFEALSAFDEDYASILEEDRGNQPEPQDREDL